MSDDTRDAGAAEQPVVRRELSSFRATPLTERFELYLPRGAKQELLLLMKEENMTCAPKERSSSLAEFLRRRIGFPR